MQIKLITIAFEPESGTFPGDPLSNLDGEVVSVVEHFFQHGGVPHLLLVVHYRPGREVKDPRSARPSHGPADGGVRSTLDESEKALYDRLRAWRNGRAQADGVPPYVLLTNRQLGELAQRRPQTLAGLCEIQGIGEAKSGRFGKDLLALLTGSGRASPPPGNAEAAHVG